MVSTQHADKRKHILQVAFEEFGESGYRETTIQTIADRVGLTPGNLYNYFKDKDDLFLSSLSGVWDEFGLAIERATDNQQISWPRRARDLFAHAESLLRKSHSLLSGSFTSEHRRARMRLDLERASQRLLAFFDEGRQQGLGMLPQDNAQALVTLRLLLGGALWTLAVVGGQEALDTELTRLRTAFLRELDGVQP